MKPFLLFILTMFISLALKAQNTPQWRPNYHFSPQKNWINDPNGLVFYQGQWHLYYQYNPEGNQWGHMSWGHAVSNDLMNWKELPLAIPEGEAYIFSGCIVVDKDNKTGLFEEQGSGLVAIYTADYHGKKEEQHLAYSTDGGNTWTKYDKNPILAEPMGAEGSRGSYKDFRDPNVFWHEPTQEWIMAVVLPKEYICQFYASRNLIDWQWKSDFGKKGDLRKIWECPALMEVDIRDVDGQFMGKKWLLAISANGPYEGFVGMQYFLGDFDGDGFEPNPSQQLPAYLDYGKDYYAAIPFQNTDRNISIGWMNNWAYAKKIPTAPWRGQMNLPRELWIQKSRSGQHLMQFPPKEVLQNKNWKTVSKVAEIPLSSSSAMEWSNKSNSFHLHIEFEILGNENVGLELLKKGKEVTRLTFNKSLQELHLDRRKSGNTVDGAFSTLEIAPLKIEQNKLVLDLFVDHSTVEVFANGGQVTMASLIFPLSKSTSWKIVGSDLQSKVKNVVLREWKNK